MKGYIAHIKLTKICKTGDEPVTKKPSGTPISG
jgi:hypothetical protein